MVSAVFFLAMPRDKLPPCQLIATGYRATGAAWGTVGTVEHLGTATVTHGDAPTTTLRGSRNAGAGR